MLEFGLNQDIIQIIILYSRVDGFVQNAAPVEFQRFSFLLSLFILSQRALVGEFSVSISSVRTYNENKQLMIKMTLLTFAIEEVNLLKISGKHDLFDIYGFLLVVKH